MKKLLLLCCFIGSVFSSQGQTYLTYSLLFLDSNQDTLQMGGLEQVTNGDSSTVGIAFSKYYLYPQGGAITDSVLIPSSYTGNSISFYYQDCNGWQSYDTTFTLGQQLNSVFYLSCQNFCSAAFNGTIDPTGRGVFFGGTTGSNYQHSWNFGNGQTGSGSSQQTAQYNSPGTYYVTHIVSNSSINCYDSVTMSFLVADSCYADFNYTMDSNTTVNFNGIYFPSSANTYWVFGDGNSAQGDSATHTYLNKADYDVTFIVETAGCRDSIVKTVMVNTNQNCDSRFSMNDVGNFQKQFIRTDSSYGTSNWYVNGNPVSQAHNYTYTASAAGNFTVVLNVTDSSNTVQCTSSKSFVFNTCGLPYQPGSVAGLVTFNGTQRYDYDSLKILLIASDTGAGTLTLIDSVTLYSADSGYYYFSICDPYQRYLVKAALDPGSTLYSGFIPTYYPSSLYWSGATHFYGIQYLTNANIDMIAGTNPGGPGFIGGYVSQGANKKDEPLDGIQVLLLTDQDVPVASLITKDGGKYKFENLALGKYKVLIEIPGKTSSIYTVTLTQDNPGAEDKNFEVNSTYISLLNTLQAPNQAAGRVYPNPAGKVLFIEWTESADENLRLEFYAIDGKLMKSIPVERMGETQSEIAIDDLPRGVYILRIQGNSSISTLRIQKD